jgi:DNA-binding NtrC family response regulator
MNAGYPLCDELHACFPPAVLLVEDDVLVRTATAAYLRERGLDVIEAGDAHQAIRMMEAKVRVDIVFSDVNMPGGIDGFGLADWVRSKRPGLKVILTSGAAHGARAANENGPILAKPYNHAALERRIRALVTP